MIHAALNPHRRTSHLRMRAGSGTLSPTLSQGERGRTKTPPCGRRLAFISLKRRAGSGALSPTLSQGERGRTKTPPCGRAFGFYFIEAARRAGNPLPEGEGANENAALASGVWRRLVGSGEFTSPDRRSSGRRR